jgi:hypothetical protein
MASTTVGVGLVLVLGGGGDVLDKIGEGDLTKNVGKMCRVEKSAIEEDVWHLLASNPRFLPLVRLARQLSSEDTKGKAAVFHLDT